MIDLNVDIGEGLPWDAELIKIASSANICCGAHAGSVELTLSTIDLCAGLRIGAHPGFRDRENFGRDEQFHPDLEDLIHQVALVQGAAYLKPHGAFYNLTARGEHLDVLKELVAASRLPLMGLPESSHELAATHGFIREGFAERGLRGKQLIPRGEPGAELHEEQAIRAQVRTLIPHVDSICVHGDRPRCVEIAQWVREEINAWN